MAKLPEPQNKTAAAIYARHERDNDDWRRAHLGASLIGRKCMRELWQTFRWVSSPNFPGRMLRLFERGEREEAWIVDELRALDMTVEDRDPSKPVEEDGQHPQYRFEALGGHIGGGCDGKVLGVLEAPKTWHVLEVKTSNDRRFKELKRDGVRKANPDHWAQMQLYMHGLGLKRALYVCVNKDNDHIYTERVQYDRAAAEALLAKAQSVVEAPEPLSRISEDPAWFECKFCSQRDTCQLGQVERLDRNCRTCTSSTPMPDGSWRCEHWGETIPDVERQRKGCDMHLFIPSLLPWEAIDADEEHRWVRYQKPGGEHVYDHHKRFTETTPP